MTNNVVAVFDTREEARGVRDELIGAGFNDQSISIIGQPPGDAARATTPPAHEKSFWEGVKDFFGFGYDDDRKAIRRGRAPRRDLRRRPCSRRADRPRGGHHDEPSSG